MREDGRSGQVLVEMLLILPVFFAIVFTIMEIGYISFRVILLNHATYEVARIGSMIWSAPGGGKCGELQEVMKQILHEAKVKCEQAEIGLFDPQSLQTNYDLIITAEETVSLVFPISSALPLLGKDGKRLLTAEIRMPIEMPLDK